MQNREAFIAASMVNFQKYLRAKAALGSRVVTAKAGLYPFITISREAGAGGHSLAHAILSQMEVESNPLFRGWNLLDQNICQEVLKDSKLHASVESLLSEKFQREVRDYLTQVVVGDSSQLAIYGRIFQIIRALAVAGKVIVVGRAGSFATRELPLGVHVRLVAPNEYRVLAMIRQFGFGRAKAEQEIKDQDQSRERLVRDYFNRDVRNPLEYDLVINMQRVNFETATQMVLELVHQKGAAMRAEPAVL